MSPMSPMSPMTPPSAYDADTSPCEWGGVPTQSLVGPLSIQPDVFEAPVIVDRVDRQFDAFRLRPPAGGALAVLDHRAGAVLLQPLVDLPDQLPAGLDVGHARLLVEQLLDLRIAVVRVVAFRAAG